MSDRDSFSAALRRSCLCAWAAVLVMTTGAWAQGPTTRKTLPADFHGHWALEGRECAAGDSGNWQVSARAIVDFESTSQVVRVEVLDRRTVRVEVRLRPNGTWFSSLFMMVLSTDGQQLTVGEHSDRSVYKRCPIDTTK
jgi:hypothetical protein